MVLAKLKICRKRSRAVAALPRARRRWHREWRRALGPKRKKYAAMPYRMIRLRVRPNRSERKAMIFSSQRLPRSRCLIHSAALVGPPTIFAPLRFMKRAAGHFALLDANRKVNQSRRRCLVLQDQGFARPHRIEKFRGPNLPALKIDSARQFNGLQHLVQQNGAGQHRERGEVSRKRWVVRRDVERAVHFHYDSLIRT